MDKLKDLIDFRNAMEDGKIVFYDANSGKPYIVDKLIAKFILKYIDPIIENLNYIFSIILQDPFATLYSILRVDSPDDSLSNKILNSTRFYGLPTLRSCIAANYAQDIDNNIISGMFYVYKESSNSLLDKLEDISLTLKSAVFSISNLNKEALEKDLLEKGYSSVEEFKEYSKILYRLYTNDKINVYLNEASIDHMAKEFGIDLQQKILNSLKDFIYTSRYFLSWKKLMGLVTKDFIDKVLSGSSPLFLKSDDANYRVIISAKDGGYVDHDESLLSNYCAWLVNGGRYDDNNNILEAIKDSINDYISFIKKENGLIMQNIEKKYNIKYDKTTITELLENHYIDRGEYSVLIFFMEGEQGGASSNTYLKPSIFAFIKEEMIDFLKLAKEDVIDSNNMFDINLFYKMFNKHLIEKYPGRQLAEILKIPGLSNINSDLRGNLAKAFGKDISDNVYKKLQSKKDELSILPEDENEKVNISGIIDMDDIRKLLMINNSINQPYSFNKAKENIKKRISIMKNEMHRYFQHASILYMVKSIPEDDYTNFLSKLEELLIRQLSQEDLFLQGKSNSLGIIDNLKDNGKPVRNNSILVPKDIIMNYDSSSENYYLFYYNTKGNNETYSPVVNFFLQFFDRLSDIFRYFIYFENEKEQFFKNNDLNSIKNSIIKILNFLASRSSRNEEESYIIIKSIDFLNSDSQISYNNKINKPSVVISNEFKGKDLGSKREYLEKIVNAFKLIHNYQFNDNIENIVKSNSFKKSYMQSIFELQNIVIPLIGNNEISDIFDEIIKSNKSIIPKEYLTEGILNFFKGPIDISSPDDYDKMINNLIGDGSNESIRRAKFILRLVNDYDGMKNWINNAKPKVPDVFEPNMSTESFRFIVLKDYDPYHFSVGADTDCCQTIGGAGEAAAIDSFINPYAGVLLLEVKTNSSWGLAAQSYFHYAEYDKKKAIILDNIEAGKYKDIYKKDFYKKAYATLASSLIKKGFDIVGCGKDYTEVISENDFEDGSLESDNRHFEVEEHGEDPYTDFDEESFFDLTKPKFDFKENETTGDTSELSAISASILEIYIRKYGSSFSKKLLKVSSFLAAGGFKKEARHVVSLAAIKV